MNPLIKATQEPPQKRPGTHLAHARERLLITPEWSSSWSGPSHTTRNFGAEKCQDLVKGVYEVATYCSPNTSLGKPEKNHCTSQLQFGSANTPAIIEADWFLLALQQMADNNSANCHNKIIRVSKWQNRSPQRYPGLMDSLKSRSRLKAFSRRDSNFIISSLDMTDSTTSTLSWREMRSRHSTTLTAQPESIWEKILQFSVGST